MASSPTAEPPPCVTVVIPAYRRPELLRLAVDSLLTQDMDGRTYEVIVVDSSPDDRNETMVRSLNPPPGCSLSFLRKAPEGPGPSRNLGVRTGRGPIIAFMDSDCQADPGWLRAGLDAFADGVGLVQGKVLPVDGVPHSVFNRTLRVESESFLYETANIFYRREAFEAAGGFVADLTPNATRPVGGEDVALAWTVKRSGWQSRFTPQALVRHAVFRITPAEWLVEKRLFICPRIVRDFPETRRFFFARYFFDRAQAALFLAVAGGLGWPLWSFWGFAGFLPYLWLRAGEQTVSMRGARRLLRAFFYLPRDLISFGILTAGSVRFRALLL